MKGGHHDLLVMVFIMLLSGFLSSMNVWADKLEHIRIHLNDVYMIFLMTGWMVFFMGVYYKHLLYIAIGAIGVIVSLFCIRTQAFITATQYAKGMIPHHSMAIHMSKKLLERNESIPQQLNTLAKNIIKGQESEIRILQSQI